MPHYEIRALDSGADTSEFNCDEPALNSYLRRYAGQDVKRGVARVFIAAPIEAPRQIAGFFTLSAASVHCETLPDPSLTRHRHNWAFYPPLATVSN